MIRKVENPYHQSHGSCQDMALHLKARLSPFMDLNELIQVGMIGLIEAAKSFDPTKGIIEFEHLPTEE